MRSSTLSYFSVFLVLSTVCKQGLSRDENKKANHNIHSILHTGSVQVPLYRKSGNKIYGQVIRTRYVYNPKSNQMEIKYTAKSPWLERFLNEVAERMYMKLQGKNVQLEKHDIPIWREMKPEILKQFRNDLIIVSYDQKNSDWVLCTIVEKWITKQHVLKGRFKAAPNQVRVFCAYKLLFPKREILRSPEPYWDYVPKKYVGETVRSVRRFKRIGMPIGVANNGNFKTILKYASSSSDGDIQKTTRTESDIATIDLFDMDIDDFTEKCKLI